MQTVDWMFDDADRHFMRRALALACHAAGSGEVPVGAVVVRDGIVLAESGNRRQTLHEVSAHAEIQALDAAGRVTGDWRLEETTLYVTLEPCTMCLEACRQSRVELIIWGAPDRKAGACGSVIDLAEDRRLGRPVAQRGGLFAAESARILREFFANRRISS
jgi:tRNA(adenine34) deaminase